MRTHRIAGAIVLAVTVLGAAPVPAVAATPAAQPRAAVLVVDCVERGRVRPADFVLACADGNSALNGLRWSRWGTASATATGRQLLNDCVPDCVGGKFHSYRVAVTLLRPQPWPGHRGQRHFTRLRMTYPAARPPDTPRTVTIPLWN